MALPQPEQPAPQPVAQVELMLTGGAAGLATRIVEIDDHLRERLRSGQLLYTDPPQRTWVGLTDEEENEYNYLGPDMYWVIQEIAAKLKERNT